MSNSTPPTADPVPDLEQIVEIRDPAIDVNHVMAQIRETLRLHGPLAQPAVPAFGVMADEGTDALAFHLSQANLNYDQVWVEINVLPSQAPLIGGLIARAKTLLHELVVYYVNLHAGKQINVNASIVRVLNTLRREQSAELAALHQEVAQLRARLAELESKQ